jgi:hypothetical protein
MTRIADIKGTTVTIERPLPWDLYNGYNPIALHAFKPALANIGVEGFSMTFKSGHYNGASASLFSMVCLTFN